MNRDPDTYFADGCGRCGRFASDDCSLRLWRPAALALRELCLQADLAEGVKWGQPCYMHAGRNVALIGALRAGAVLGFFDAGGLADPEGLLVRRGPQSRAADTLRVTDAAEVARLAPAITRLLRQARDIAAGGARPPRPRPAPPPELPEELAAALAADPALAAAFDRLTPGRKRSFIIDQSSARTTATRLRRIEGYKARILAGRGLNERPVTPPSDHG